jgi:hypothetical protein
MSNDMPWVVGPSISRFFCEPAQNTFLDPASAWSSIGCRLRPARHCDLESADVTGGSRLPTY